MSKLYESEADLRAGAEAEPEVEAAEELGEDARVAGAALLDGRGQELRLAYAA